MLYVFKFRGIIGVLKLFVHVLTLKTVWFLKQRILGFDRKRIRLIFEVLYQRFHRKAQNFSGSGGMRGHKG